MSNDVTLASQALGYIGLTTAKHSIEKVTNCRLAIMLKRAACLFHAYSFLK